MVKAEPLSTEENIRYAFKHGRCTVPAISLPRKEGIVSFIASHSRHSDLSLSFKVGTVLHTQSVVTTFICDDNY